MVCLKQPSVYPSCYSTTVFVQQWPETTGVHHNKARETPLSIYIGLTIHTRTRKRDVIETSCNGHTLVYDCGSSDT